MTEKEEAVVRERRFDYDVAYEMRFRHRIPVATLAKKFGVSDHSIRRATEEGYRRLHRACSARSYAKRTFETRRARMEAEKQRRGLV